MRTHNFTILGLFISLGSISAFGEAGRGDNGGDYYQPSPAPTPTPSTERVYVGRIADDDYREMNRPRRHFGFNLNIGSGFGGFFNPALNAPLPINYIDARMGVGGACGGAIAACGPCGGVGVCGGAFPPGGIHPGVMPPWGVGVYPPYGPHMFPGNFAQGPGFFPGGVSPFPPAAPVVPPPPQVIPPHMQMPNLGWGPGFASFPGPQFAPGTCGVVCGSGLIPPDMFAVPGGPFVQNHQRFNGGGLGLNAGLTLIDMRTVSGESDAYFWGLASVARDTTTTVTPLAFPGQGPQIQPFPWNQGVRNPHSVLRPNQ